MILNLHLKNEENYGKKTKIKIMIATLKIVKQRIKSLINLLEHLPV
jgi:hypothetical protein